MNSIERKLARCAREIEAARPKGLSFDDFRFLNHDIKGAAKKVRTVEDVLSDPTEDEMQYIIKLRGGCRCSWPNAAPPCSICTTEYSEAEAAEALEETAPPSPAVTPDDGWIEWKGEIYPPAEIISGVRYQLDWEGEGITGPRVMHDPDACNWACCLAYRVVKP